MARTLLLLAVLLPLLSAAADEKEPLESRVNRAIDRGAAHLVEMQGEDGSWRKDDKAHPLGRTALCAFTLLHAGYPSDHVAIRKALAFLGVERGYAKSITPNSTYEAACIVLLLNALGKDQREPIHDICRWLEENFNWTVGLWGYPKGTPDMSNTQYAALALKAGERHGYKASKKIWKRLVDSSIRLQSPTGGFRYRGGSVYRATMTHAAMLVLKFAQEALGAKAPKKRIQAAMNAGHQWLEEHYSVERNPDGRGWRKAHYYYYMYGLERYAVFFGKKTIAGHDWYREGAEELLDRQNKNGGWGRLPETCFAILFLRRATLSEPSARAIGEVDEQEGREKPRRPRPKKSVKGIREWLVAGPFVANDQEDNQLFEETIPVTRVKPVAGGKAGKMKWVLHRSRTDKIDFKDSVGERAWAAYYAAVWLHAEEETEAVVWLDSDDGLRAWLDGEEILFGHHHGHCGRDYYRVPVKLAKGRNLLLLHVENLEYYCYFHARVSNSEGKPHPGVTPSVGLTAPKRK